ncbi:MAG: hypothetical protein AAGH76_13930 [Pseudomonadota bacterium]
MSIDRLAGIGSLVVVGTCVIIGLFLAGSPYDQRLKRLDKQRVSDLRRVVYAIDENWTGNNALPAVLPELVDGRTLRRLPSDPVTGIPYEYEIVDAGRYRLCAEFATARDAYSDDDFWTHPKGRHCFALEAKRRN